ncbi:MAG: IS3 family transposase [Solirubrobacteraceae bacterium]
MKRTRHTAEQVIRKLRDADRMLAEGNGVAEVARALGVSENTYHRWRNRYGGMKADDVKRLKELERENGRLKAIVADQALQCQALKEVGQGKLVSPARRRAAVAMLRDRLDVSERWACRVLGQHRSTQRHAPPAPAADDGELRVLLRELAARKPRWGYRRAHAHLRENGRQINRKRVQRVWREEGLRVPQRARKRRRTGDPEAKWLRAERPNQLWALDFQYDQTADGRMLRLLNVVDEFTREALVMQVDRSITAGQTVAALARLVAVRGCPENVRCDNGPELTAHALRDWCASASVTTSYIEPGAPWQNPFAESFNARVRDELLNLEDFSCLAEAQVLTEDWRDAFNREHPHSALGWKSPAAFAAAWATTPATT